MKISKDELENMIKEELAKEGITEVSLNPFKRAEERGQQTGLGWREKLSKFLDKEMPGPLGSKAGDAGSSTAQQAPPAGPSPSATPSGDDSQLSLPLGADAKPATAAAPRKVMLSMKDRGPGSESSSIHNIALGIQGLEKPPNPNGSPEEKELNKKFNKVMILLTKGIENTIKQIDPNVKVGSVNESVKE